MAENKDTTHIVATIRSDAGSIRDSVGAKWFVAIVNNRSEKAYGEKLSKIGVENYVPTQTTLRVWKNGKKAKVERVVIPAIIFVRCTEEERREIVKLPYIFRFMTNKAGASGNSMNKPIAVVSDSEIEQLRFMLGQSDVAVTITEHVHKPGDKVRIIRGSLAGLEGEVFGLDANKSEVIVALECFGCAKLTIDTVNLEPVKQ